MKPPTPKEIGKMRRGSVLLSLVYAYREPKVVQEMIEAVKSPG